MNTSEQLDQLAPALLKAQAELAPVKQDGYNPQLQTKYASLDAIQDFVRPILMQHGLIIVQGDAPAPEGSIGIATRLLHVSGQYMENQFVLPLEVKTIRKAYEGQEAERAITAQSVGSAISYGRRYGLGSILALTVEHDDDGNGASRTKQNQNRQTNQRPQQQTQNKPPQQTPPSSSNTPPPQPTAAEARFAKYKRALETADAKGLKAAFQDAWRGEASSHGVTTNPQELAQANPEAFDNLFDAVAAAMRELQKPAEPAPAAEPATSAVVADLVDSLETIPEPPKVLNPGAEQESAYHTTRREMLELLQQLDDTKGHGVVGPFWRKACADLNVPEVAVRIPADKFPQVLARWREHCTTAAVELGLQPAPAAGKAKARKA
jgi:hypothetical protein